MYIQAAKIHTLKANSSLTRKGKETACNILFSLSVCSICLSFTTWTHRKIHKAGGEVWGYIMIIQIFRKKSQKRCFLPPPPTFKSTSSLHKQSTKSHWSCTSIHHMTYPVLPKQGQHDHTNNLGQMGFLIHCI